ncbi:T-cell surface glycoprotein CD8 alpha chain, partial [Galemys pyrenaicus]
MPPSLLPREHAMTSPVATLLLPLALLLDAAAANSFRMSKQPEHPQLKGKVELKCEVLMTSSPQGCSWLFQRREVGAGPRFLVYVSRSRNKLGEDVLPSELEGERIDDSRFKLTLLSFQENEQGYYFCSVLSNSIIYFSPLVPVFLPAKPTTQPPPPPRPPTPAPTNASQLVTRRPEVCPPSAGSDVNSKALDFSCNIYIWAPLAGTCALLLLSLITVVIYNH